jgi:hypothetical protein
MSVPAANGNMDAARVRNFAGGSSRNRRILTEISSAPEKPRVLKGL